MEEGVRFSQAVARNSPDSAVRTVKFTQNISRTVNQSIHLNQLFQIPKLKPFSTSKKIKTRFSNGKLQNLNREFNGTVLFTLFSCF